jgi:hypothetical protein
VELDLKLIHPLMPELAARAIEIADTAVEGETAAQVARARLRVDARFRLAAAWNGSTFGNRPSLTVHSSSQPVSLGLTPEQVRRLARLAREAIAETEPEVSTLRQLAPVRR